MSHILHNIQKHPHYQYAKKHSATEADVTSKNKICYLEFPDIYALRHYKNALHGFPITTTTFGPDIMLIDFDDVNLKRESRSC